MGNKIINVCPWRKTWRFDRFMIVFSSAASSPKRRPKAASSSPTLPQEGEVLAVGPGARGEQGQIQPLDVKVGDRILFGKWSGTEIKIDGEDLLIMKESDVMGIIEARAAEKIAA
jgi:co-chaperonin GroES (HSP10)